VRTEGLSPMSGRFPRRAERRDDPDPGFGRSFLDERRSRAALERGESPAPETPDRQRARAPEAGPTSERGTLHGGPQNDDDRHPVAHGRFTFPEQRSCEPLPIREEGRRARSFCSIGNPIGQLRPFMHRCPNEPVNLDKDEELTVLEIAERIRELTGSRSELVFLPRPEDGPERRRPDLRRASAGVAWMPQWGRSGTGPRKRSRMWARAAGRASVSIGS